MRFDLKTLRGDIFGGVLSAVVSLPLALAFGVASGLGPVAGLYGAIAVGFLAAVLGGTPTQISGPTGPTSIATAVIVAQHADNLAEVATIVMLSGLLQIAFGLIRFGRYVTYTPYSVVSGFMSGIGVIIIILQTLPFLGVATGGRAAPHRPRVAGGPGHPQPGRPEHCRRVARGLRLLAATITQYTALPARGPGHWDRGGGLVVPRSAGHRRGAHRVS